LLCAFIVSLSGCGPSEQGGIGIDDESIAPVLEAIVDIPLTNNTFEPTVAVNPANPANVIVAVGNAIQFSQDGGQTFSGWIGANFPPGVGSQGDSALAFDNAGNLYWGLLGPYDQYVQKVNPISGTLVGNAVDVSAQNGFATGISDKGWVAADRFAASPCKNNVYAVYSTGAMQFSRSTNGGANWNAPITLSSAADNRVRQVHIAVGLDGAVYVAYHSAINGPTSENPTGSTGRIVFQRSDDCGVTFPAANKKDAITAGFADLSYNFQYQCTTPGPNGTCAAGTPNTPRKLFRNQNLMLGSGQPFIITDPTNAQNVAIVTSDDPTNTVHGGSTNDDAAVVISRSVNKGTSWPVSPTTIDLDASKTLQLMSTAGTDVNSQCIAVSYYDNRGTTLNGNGNSRLNLLLRGSSNFGAGFGSELAINDTQFDPDLNAGGAFDPNPPFPANYVKTLRIGEYNGVAVSHGVAHAVYTNNDTSGSQRIFYDNARVCSNNTLPPTNGHIIAARQSANIPTAVFSVGQDGALYRRWVTSAGVWNGPSAITSAGFVPAGAPLVAVSPSATELDVFFVGNDGKVYYAFETNDGAWSVAPALTGASFAAPGAHLATAFQNFNQFDVFVVDAAGTLQVFGRLIGFGWSANIPISSSFAVSGAALTAANHPGANQVDVMAVGTNGGIRETSVIGAGVWSLPIAVTAAGVAASGSHLGSALQGPSQLDVFYVGTNGAPNILWFINNSAPFGPVALTAASTMPSTGELTAYALATNQVDVFFTNNSGAVSQMYVIGAGAWTGPLSLTINGDAVPGASSAIATQGSTQWDLFTVGNVYMLEGTTTTGTSWTTTTPLLP
jgi:hypothetical protein